MREHGYDVGVLVAFSDAVAVDGGEPVTEAKLNGFAESQTAGQLDTDAYQVMVVAVKFRLRGCACWPRGVCAITSSPGVLQQRRPSVPGT